MLPLETDLNTLPMIPNIPEKVFPNDAKNTEGDPTWHLIIIIWLKEREKKYWHVVNILFELSSTDALYTRMCDSSFIIVIFITLLEYLERGSFG